MCIAIHVDKHMVKSCSKMQLVNCAVAPEFFLMPNLQSLHCLVDTTVAAFVVKAKSRKMDQLVFYMLKHLINNQSLIFEIVYASYQCK